MITKRQNRDYANRISIMLIILKYCILKSHVMNGDYIHYQEIVRN